MTETIQIKTTIAGLKLYNVATKNLQFYTSYLDNIKKWKNQLEKINTVFPTAFQAEDYNCLHTQLEINGLFTISILDLSIISREIFIAKYVWEQLFYAKHGYLVIYETIQTYNKHGKFLSEIANKFTPELQSDFKNITSQIKDFKKDFKYDSEIKEIRKNTAGHIESDFIKYYETISKVNPQKALETIKSFILIITQLQKYSSHLIKAHKDKIEYFNLKRRDDHFSKLKDIISKFEILNKDDK
jgi:hypothetical protein